MGITSDKQSSQSHPQLLADVIAPNESQTKKATYNQNLTQK